MTEKRADKYLALFSKHVDPLMQPKLLRWARSPLKHFIGFAVAYGRVVKSMTMRGRLFTGDDIRVPLPAGLDLFLTGIKTHDSEVRLTRYLLKNLGSGQTFMDAGAHLGYYSLVASHLVGENGRVFCFEPDPRTFSFLKQNTATRSNITAINSMLGDEEGNAIFYSFPTRYSEFNTASKESIQTSLRKAAMTITVSSTTIDQFCASNELHPDVIKIDVEGSEYSVLKGSESILRNYKPAMCIEFRQDQYDVLYRPIVFWLREQGYLPLIILENGDTRPTDDISDYLDSIGEESDNIVFVCSD